MNPQRTPSTGGLSSALSEAQSIIAAAEQRAEEIRRASNEALEDAKKAGFEQGRLEGKQEANATAVRLLEQVGALQDEIAREAARLSIEICHSILREQFSIDETKVVQLARQALEHSISATNVVLVAHPDDVDILQREIDMLRRAARGGTIHIEAEASLSRGGCIVRTEFGEVDASIEAILRSLSERLGV